MIIFVINNIIRSLSFGIKRGGMVEHMATNRNAGLLRVCSLKACLLFSFLFFSAALVFTGGAQAQDGTSDEDIVQGARLYDAWFAATGVEPPSQNMPIWSRQSTNTRSGPDTWRCSECHGWDYRGNEGEYATGSHRTGFPNVKAFAGQASIEEIVARLKGSEDPEHDFSPYLEDASLNQLAVFLKEGTVDPAEYIDPISLKTIGADVQHGQQLYNDVCSECHGEDGKEIIFRTEGINEYIGSVANRDPWRFLHRTRFGVAGTQMAVGHTFGWTPEDGRDILAYAQGLPAGGEIATRQPAGETSEVGPGPRPPAFNLLQGIVTGILAFLGASIYVLLFVGGFIVLGALVVALLRQRK